LSGGNCLRDFLAKENIVRRGVKDSRRRGDIRPFKHYWNALEMIKYLGKVQEAEVEVP
jgi:hypothetical protein